MNQAKNPEYRSGRVDIAVEQCVLSVSVDGFTVVFFFLSFLLFPPPVFLLFEVLMLKSGKRPEATLVSPGVT